MECRNVHKTDFRDCLAVLLKNKNKRVSFDEWKNKKMLEASKAIQFNEAESCVVKLFERMVQNANNKSLSHWLKRKNVQAKKVDAKQKIEEVCLKTGARELEVLEKNYSKKAFKSWMKLKGKETREKNLRMKKDEACRNLGNEYFYLVKSEYNKKAVEDWLYYLKARHK